MFEMKCVFILGREHFGAAYPAVDVTKSNIAAVFSLVDLDLERIQAEQNSDDAAR
jgi:hypothetical protein